MSSERDAHSLKEWYAVMIVAHRPTNLLWLCVTEKKKRNVRAVPLLSTDMTLDEVNGVIA